jgi:hypothetical protein
VRHRQHLHQETAAEIDRVITEHDMIVLDQQRPGRVAREHRPKPWLRPDRDPVCGERLATQLSEAGEVAEVTMGEQDPVDGRVVDRPRRQVIEEAQLLTDRRCRVDQPSTPIGTDEGEAGRGHRVGVGTARAATADLGATTVLADTEDDRLGRANPSCDRRTRHA